MDTIRWGGLSAVFGGLLGIALTPVAAAAGHLAWGHPRPRPWNDDLPLLIQPFRSYAEYMFTLPPPAEVYPTYGKVFLIVFLLFTGGLLGLRALVYDKVDKRGRLGIRLALIGLVMNVFGNISDYWLGYDVLGQPWWGLFFVIGTEVGFLVYLIGSILLGRSLLRGNVLPAWMGWTLVVAPPMGIVFTFWGVGHVPSGMVFALSVCWVLVGLVLLTARSAMTSQVELAT
jgi:hypothetical protein